MVISFHIREEFLSSRSRFTIPRPGGVLLFMTVYNLARNISLTIASHCIVVASCPSPSCHSRHCHPPPPGHRWETELHGIGPISQLLSHTPPTVFILVPKNRKYFQNSPKCLFVSRVILPEKLHSFCGQPPVWRPACHLC